MAAETGNTTPAAPSPEHLEHLYRLMGGFRVSQAIYVVAELGIADLLASGPQGSDALASATHANEDALYRVLRLLTGVGLFEEITPRHFSLTPLGAGLRRDALGSIHALAVNVLDEPRWSAWGQLLHSVRTGDIGFNHVHGMPLFDYLAAHEEEGERFNQAMTGNTARSGRAIVGAYDFTDVQRLVDVGGGHGLLLATILNAQPAMQGVLYDLPAVVAGAAPVLAAAGVADRCEMIGGDFFVDVPTGGDAYILRHIIHDWDDRRATAILANCRRALPDGGRVLVVEPVIGTDYRKALPTLHLDLQMLVLLGGKERTEAEYRTLFAAAGLQLQAVVPLGDAGQFCILEGVSA